MSDKKKKKPAKKVKKVELGFPQVDPENKDRSWRYAWERPWKPGLEIRK